VLIVVPALWGLVFVGVSEVLQYLNAFQIVTIRFFMISVLFSILMMFRPNLRPHYTRSQWKTIWLAGLMAVPLSQLGIVYAQNWLQPSLASLIITTAPAVAAVLAPLFLPETVARRQAVGFVLAVVGAAIVIIVGAGGADLTLRNLLGAAVGMITPFAWATYTILQKRLSAEEPLAIVGIGLMVGTVFMIPWLPGTLRAVAGVDAGTWLWLVYLAFFGTFAAYLVWFWSLKSLDASQASAYLYLVPVFALIWSLIILREPPPAAALVGGAFVVAGVALTQRGARGEVVPPVEA
jgi:drug/metabolite transporter (DMT)-like permease